MTFDDFSWHENALKGIRGPISADEPMSGFYRQKNRAGQYEPVAYWKDSNTGEQRCHINGKSPADPLRMFEVWPHASRHPISEEAYWHRMDTGQWLDNDAGAAAAAKGPEIDPETDPAGSLKAEIDAAKAGLDAYKTIESDEAAARAQTLRSALTSLKGKAETAYEALNRPLLEEQKRIRGVWFPLRDDAEAAANTLRKAMGAWEDFKREAARKAQAEADRIAREHAESARKAEEANQPPPPPPPAAPKPNAPAPSAQIKGASGRAASVSTKPFVVSIDIDKFVAQFRDDPNLAAALMELAQKYTTAGIKVDGAVIEERAVVR